MLHHRTHSPRKTGKHACPLTPAQAAAACSSCTPAPPPASRAARRTGGVGGEACNQMPERTCTPSCWQLHKRGAPHSALPCPAHRRRRVPHAQVRLDVRVVELGDERVGPVLRGVRLRAARARRGGSAAGGHAHASGKHARAGATPGKARSWQRARGEPRTCLHVHVVLPVPLAPLLLAHAQRVLNGLRGGEGGRRQQQRVNAMTCREPAASSRTSQAHGRPHPRGPAPAPCP